MKVALITNNNSYAGREYLSKLIGIDLDVICINKPNSNELEKERCKGLWNPPSLDSLKDKFNFYFFSDLDSQELMDFLKEENYYLGIQGNTGIIKKDVIQSFKGGIINFHPGDLPNFRGCSTPEWQIYERKKVVCTAHLLDEGIDTGDIIRKQKLELDLTSYSHFRASIYPEISKFVKSIILEIKQDEKIIEKAIKQNSANAKYRQIMNPKLIKEVEEIIFNMDSS